MADVKTIAEQLVNLSVKEVKELADILKNKYGIEPFGASPAPIPRVPPAPPAQTAFDVILVNAGAGVLNVVKIIKTLTGMGLKEAKDLVDAAPSVVKTKISKEEAEAIKIELVEAGATVEIK